MCVSFFKFLIVSRHIPGPIVCVSHFPLFLFHRHIPGRTIGVSHFPVGQFSCHNPGPTMYNSNFSLFFAIFQVIQCVSLIFNFFQFCRHFSRSYSVHFSYSTFFRFLAIFQVLECPFLTLHFFHCFSQFPAPTVCVSPVPRFSVFSPYSRCSIVCVSFYMIFRFLSIFQVLP